MTEIEKLKIEIFDILQKRADMQEEYKRLTALKEQKLNELRDKENSTVS